MAIELAQIEPRALHHPAFDQDGESSATVERRRRFPCITDNAQARARASTIAGWAPLRLPPRPPARPRFGKAGDCARATAAQGVRSALQAISDAAYSCTMIAQISYDALACGAENKFRGVGRQGPQPSWPRNQRKRPVVRLLSYACRWSIVNFSEISSVTPKEIIWRARRSSRGEVAFALRGTVGSDSGRCRFPHRLLPLEQVRSSALWRQIVKYGGRCVLPDVKFVARVSRR